MPGKSRRRKGQYAQPSKKRKSTPSRPTLLKQPPAIAPAPEPVPSPDASVPLDSIAKPVAKPVMPRHPHIGSELRTTGILAVTLLIVLIVLALVFS